MEAFSDLPLLAVLSPPYQAWLTRDDCPHPLLGVCGSAPVSGLLPAGPWSRTCLSATAVLVVCAGAALLYWRLKPRTTDPRVHQEEPYRLGRLKVTIIPSSPPHTHPSPRAHSTHHSSRTHYEEIEGQEISFLDSEESGDETTPVSSASDAGQETEFNLSFTHNDSAEESQSEEEDEGAYSLTAVMNSR